MDDRFYGHPPDYDYRVRPHRQRGPLHPGQRGGHLLAGALKGSALSPGSLPGKHGDLPGDGLPPGPDSPEEECDMVINYIYPKFKENNINTKILIWDHNKEKLYIRILQELNFNEKAKDIISGAAFHFYSGSHFENIALLRQNNDFKDKLLIHTEGCTGYSNFNEKDFIHNAEIYAHDILGDLLSGANGYIDWNLVLDNNGGPNHKKNYCDSPIMLNKDNTDYIKNLSFYYIAHFSKYIKRNAKVLAISRYTTDIETLAIKNPDDSIAIIMLNKFGFDKKFNICINGFTFSDKIEAHSIITYVISEN